MEANQPKTGKFSWIYGIIAGMAGVVFSLIRYFMDMLYNQHMALNIIPIILLVAIVIWGIAQYKKANDGFLSMSNALKLGAGIGVVSAIVAVLYTLLLTNVIEPDFMANMMEPAKQKALARNPEMTDEQWQMGVNIQKYIQYPLILILSTIVGLIVGAITGAIMKNPRPE